MRHKTRSGRRLQIALLICDLFFFAAGCNRPQSSRSGSTIIFEINPQPVHVGPVKFAFVIKDAALKPVAGAKITVEADMSHPGMSPVFGESHEVAPGRYESQLIFAMAGDWVILLHGTLPDGTKLERQFDVRGVRPN